MNTSLTEVLNNVTCLVQLFRICIQCLFCFSEFIPYVFQILSLLIDYHTSGTVPDTYMALFPHLLAPALWERPGNIPPLVRLIQAYIEKGAKQIPVENVVGKCLGQIKEYVWFRLP